MHTKKLAVFLLAVALLATPMIPAQQAGSAPTHSASTANDSLRLTAAAHDPVNLAASELKALPHIMVTVHNPHTNSDETYSGVRVADLLAKIGEPLGKDLRGVALSSYLVATGSERV